MTNLNYNKKFLPKKIKPKYNKEFYYILGVQIGDGFVLHIKTNREYSINLKTTDKDFIIKFNKTVQKYTNYVSRFYKEKNKSCKLGFNYRVKFRSIELYNLITKETKIPLKNYPKNKINKINLLNGLYDSEGFAHKTQKKVGFYSTDKKIINLTKKLLKELGIHSKIWKTTKRDKPYYELNIFGKENIIKFDKLIGFTSDYRQQRLNNLIKSYR